MGNFPSCCKLTERGINKQSESFYCFLCSKLMLHWHSCSPVSLQSKSLVAAGCLCSLSSIPFLYLLSPHLCCMRVLSASLSSLLSTPGSVCSGAFISLPQGESWTSRPPSTPPHSLVSWLLCPHPFFCCPSSAPGGHKLPLSQIAGKSRFLIILLTVHLSDKAEERQKERPLASLSFNGQPRNEGDTIKARAEPDFLFNVSDRPDRIINQELKEFKTFALGFLT